MLKNLQLHSMADLNAYKHVATTGLNSVFVTPVRVTADTSNNIMATIVPEYAAANPTGSNLLTKRRNHESGGFMLQGMQQLFVIAFVKVIRHNET